jgi:hypothetical protein
MKTTGSSPHGGEPVTNAPKKSSLQMLVKTLQNDF